MQYSQIVILLCHEGLVVYLRGLTDAAFTGNIFEIILKILRERRQSQLKNIRELKIRANIEDDECMLIEYI